MQECGTWSDLLGKLLTKTDNIAILILVVMVGVLMFAIFMWRREDRQDKKEAWQVVEANSKALTELRIVLAQLRINGG